MNTNEHAGMVRITTFRAAESDWERLHGALELECDAMRQAEGCFGAQVCSIDGRDDAVAVVSRWRDRRYLNEYFKEEGPDVALETVASLVHGRPETLVLQSVTTVSPEVR
jgi:quinol monooxygenase YgiN